MTANRRVRLDDIEPLVHREELMAKLIHDMGDREWFCEVADDMTRRHRAMFPDMHRARV
jgi:hypothetical protein